MLPAEGRVNLMGQRIVIIGNGIAGNSAAEAIRTYDSDAKVTIISCETAPLYSPCAFYRYLAGDIPKNPPFAR